MPVAHLLWDTIINTSLQIIGAPKLNFYKILSEILKIIPKKVTFFAGFSEVEKNCSVLHITYFIIKI